MLPTIDLSTILKLGVRAVVRGLFKSSIGMFVYAAAMIGTAAGVLYNRFGEGFFPRFKDLINFDTSFMSDNAIVSTVLYALDFDTLFNIFCWCWSLVDDIIVFFVTFLVTLCGAMCAYKWSAAFRDDLRSLYEGL